MLTIEKLDSFGVDTARGLERCLNNEAFYFRLIGMALEDKNFERLGAAIEDGDLDTAFDAAHALKGTTGNLSLDPLYEPLCEVTELLRAKTEMDYSQKISLIMEKLDELRNLAG